MKDIGVRDINEASKLLCFQYSEKECCDSFRCKDWVELSKDTGYCNNFRHILHYKDLNLDNLDLNSLLTKAKAVQEYQNQCHHVTCQNVKCMGWIKIKKDLGYCVLDPGITEKYSTGVVEGATNFMQIKRVWDNTYDVLVKMLDETQKQVESNYSMEELGYIIIKVLSDLQEGEDSKDNFYYNLKSFIRMGTNDSILEVNEDFAILLTMFMMVGATLYKYMAIQEIAEKIIK